MEIKEFENTFKLKYRWTSSFISGFLLAIIDAVIVMLCIGFGFFIINLIDRSAINFRSFVKYSIYLPFIIFVFWTINLYPGVMMAPEDEVKKYCISSFFSFLGIAFSVSLEGSKNKWAIAAALALAFPAASFCLPVGREIAKGIFSKYRFYGVPVVLYSKETRAKVVVDRLLKFPKIGYRPSIIITDSDWGVSEYKGIPVYFDSKEVFETIKRLNIKVAVICDYDKDIDLIMSHYRYTVIVPKKQIINTMSMHMSDIGGILGFSVTHNLTKGSNLIIKRLIDIGIILCTLPITIPVMLIISILVKCTSKGPVFYGHERVGKNGKKFKAWKFRSMCIDSQERLEKILATDPVRRMEWEKDRKFTDDPRVTKFGKVLRKSSLDELPQLFNILTGQMSFVGPRPVTEPELEKYGKYADYVFSVQPGLSGMWQISGRSDTGYEERITLDTYYIQNWSIWLDLWILIKTIWVVLMGKGAY